MSIGAAAIMCFNIIIYFGLSAKRTIPFGRFLAETDTKCCLVARQSTSPVMVMVVAETDLRGG